MSGEKKCEHKVVFDDLLPRARSGTPETHLELSGLRCVISIYVRGIAGTRVLGLVQLIVAAREMFTLVVAANLTQSESYR